jgi:hypothetical protein
MRDFLYLIFFLLFGDTILIFASVATPDPSQDMVVLQRIVGFLLMGQGVLARNTGVWRCASVALGGCAYAMKNTLLPGPFHLLPCL